MLMIDQARARRVDAAERQAGQELEQSSPIKTVLGSLATTQTSDVREKTHSARKKLDAGGNKPSRIEDVPFRRQDRRILNARNRRIMDRKLIIFIVAVGLILLCVGGSLLGLYLFYESEYSGIRPFVIIGPVLIGGGVITLFCSIEVCVRLVRAKRRVQDPELDNLINPHEVKHWIDPKIIPYGWGLFSDDDEVLVIEKDATNPLSLGGGRQGSSYSGAVSTGQVSDRLEEEREGRELTDSPHRALAMYSDDSDVDSSSCSLQPPDPLFSSDVYSKSLKYSHVSRPELVIDISSPVKQNTGDFVDVEDKILKLFDVPKKRTVRTKSAASL